MPPKWLKTPWLRKSPTFPAKFSTRALMLKRITSVSRSLRLTPIELEKALKIWLKSFDCEFDPTRFIRLPTLGPVNRAKG